LALAGADERARKEAAKAGTMGWLAGRYFGECQEFKKLYDKSRRARRACIEDCLREPLDRIDRGERR
jgi:hypothetical protein